MPAFTQRAAGARAAGERLFVDHAAHAVDVIDPATGEVGTALLFVALLGALSHTFAEASWTQSLPDWITSHVRAFGFFGGVTAQIVSDNLKAGGHEGLLLRPDNPPDLRRYGRALRPGRGARAAAQTSG